MLFFIAQSTEPELTPTEVILGDTSQKKFVKSLEIRRIPVEAYYGKLKKIFPYGKKFSTESAEIIEMTEALYQIGSFIYSYTKRKREKVLVKVVSKKEVRTSKKCKYKMYLATFYDEETQDTFTKYLVEA